MVSLVPGGEWETMEAGGQELNLLSGPTPGTHLNRPHRSRALDGAVPFGAKGVIRSWSIQHPRKADAMRVGSPGVHSP
jgi:hypothetical protein